MMQANYVQRVRLRFSKVEMTRYISHLDLARALERALNRSQLPVSYSQGYNPRPRMQFANALPLGFTSEAELADVWLEEETEPQQVRAQLAEKMPPGLVLHEVWEVPLSAAAMQASTTEATYVASIGDSGDCPDETALRKRVNDLLAAETLVRERRGKEYDLRPLILALHAEPAQNGDLSLTMRLSLLPGKTGRPDEVLDALGLDPLEVRVHRTEIVLDEEGRA